MTQEYNLKITSAHNDFITSLQARTGQNKKSVGTTLLNFAQDNISGNQEDLTELEQLQKEMIRAEQNSILEIYRAELSEIDPDNLTTNEFGNIVWSVLGKFRDDEDYKEVQCCEPTMHSKLNLLYEWVVDSKYYNSHDVRLKIVRIRKSESPYNFGSLKTFKKRYQSLSDSVNGQPSLLT